MKLYGPSQDPLTRAVRVVARRLGVSVIDIDAEHPIGQQALRDVSPLWLSPVADLRGTVLLDARTILAELLLLAPESGGAPLWRPADEAERREDANVQAVILGGLGALREADELYAEGGMPSVVEEGGEPFPASGRREHFLEARGRRALEWLEHRLDQQRLHRRAFNTPGELGVAEILLYCALDWLGEREIYPVHIHAGLARFLDAWRDDPLFQPAAPAGET